MLSHDDLDQIRKVVREEVKPIDMKLDKVQEDVSDILTALDQRQTRTEHRINRLEDEVGIGKPQ